MNIIGAENLSDEEIALKLTNGWRLVSYKYCFSIVVLTFRRTSPLYLVPVATGSLSQSFKYAAISFFFGWWGIPWGIIYTIQCLYNSLSGGDDYSQTFINEVSPNKRPSNFINISNTVADEKRPAIATASIFLGLLSIICNLITAVPAVICGHIALNQISKRGSARGKEFAIVGLALGYISILLAIVVLIHKLLSKSA